MNMIKVLYGNGRHRDIDNKVAMVIINWINKEEMPETERGPETERSSLRVKIISMGAAECGKVSQMTLSFVNLQESKDQLGLQTRDSRCIRLVHDP